MAVLVEAISVIVAFKAAMDAYHGDAPAFEADVPNATMCHDGELIRVGFMAPAAVEAYVALLRNRGLTYLDAGIAHDMVVVDQQRGPLAPCDWVEFGHVPLGGDVSRMIACCRLSGTLSQTLSCPPGWDFQNSLSASFSFVPSAHKDKSLVFQRRENGLTVYRSALTGKEVFIAEPDSGGSVG